MKLLYLFGIFLSCLIFYVQAGFLESDRRHLRELNRILERRQGHAYHVRRSVKELRNLGFQISSTDSIASLLRQLRRYRKDKPDDDFIARYYDEEHDRMEEFVQDVDRLNALTSNRLYDLLGHVKDEAFDSLNGYILREIDYLSEQRRRAEDEDRRGQQIA